MAENLIGRPKLSGVIRESHQYSDMGSGDKPTLLLIGHADGLAINDPHHVINVQEAINLMEADQNSPLLRAMLEAYNAGARDIWIVAAAPMSEYESDVDARFEDNYLTDAATPVACNFYEKYYERLTATYSLLEQYDMGHIVVPVEAVWYDAGDVDFAEQLFTFCSDSFAVNSVVKIGMLGTRVPTTTDIEDAIEYLTDRTRIESYGADAKFTSVFFGEVIVNPPQFSNTYRTPAVVLVAANAAVLGLNRGISFVNLPTALNTTTRDFTNEELEALANAQINPVIRNIKGRRGQAFNVVPFTDNTLGFAGISSSNTSVMTDYWSLAQMRLIMMCANVIRVMGYNVIGSSDFFSFKRNVYDYLAGLVQDGSIKDFSLDMQLSDTYYGKVYVEVTLTPFFGVRQIYFTVETGQGS